MKGEILLAILSICMFAFSCASSKPTEQDKSTNPTPQARPQYEITVTQSGAELGKIVVETFSDITPIHARNFDSLVKIGFYDGTKFHRVIPGFVIQGGDPNTKSKPVSTWGTGDPSQTTIPAEFHKQVLHKRGVLSMARRGGDINSGTSQFFITVADVNFLDPNKPDSQGRYTDGYTVFGQVLSGMDVVDKIVSTPTVPQDRPAADVSMSVKRLK